MSNNRKTFADNLKYYMKLKNINSKELASIVGVRPSTLCYWVNGENYPRIDSIQKMADFFGVTVSDLVGEKKSSEDGGLSPAKYKLLQTVDDLSEEEISKVTEAIKTLLGMR